MNRQKQQAKEALRVYPKGLQIGGGITDENAYEYIECGASHVIVTSYVFRGGEILQRKSKEACSCRRKRAYRARFELPKTR